MSQTRKFRLYVLRYVGDVPRQEFVNIGVCLAEWADGSNGFVGFEFLTDWRRLGAFFPEADVDLVRDWCAQLGAQLGSVETREAALRDLAELDTTISVFIDSRALESHQDPKKELHTVAEMYLA